MKKKGWSVFESDHTQGKLLVIRKISTQQQMWVWGTN